MPETRRHLLLTGALAALAVPAASSVPRIARADAGIAARLREGGVVIALRHARAPGTFDPPEFRLDDCRTQRNLDDAGRAQARRIGQWFQERSLRPARVRSSPWCRCIDTAELAFGTAERWAALGSPHGATRETAADHLRQLRAALGQAARERGRFEAWVTHMFVLRDLTGVNTDSGEGLLLAPGAGGSIEVLARLSAS